jgi:hypothetical protein
MPTIPLKESKILFDVDDGVIVTDNPVVTKVELVVDATVNRDPCAT